MSEVDKRVSRMMDQMTKFDENEAADFITEMMTQIKEPNRRIPENVFREIFLPVFAGLDPDMEKRTQEFTAHWAGVVGSAMEPADVVDVQGNKLFTVPPLYDSSRLMVDEKGSGTGSYRHIFGSLIENASVNPTAAAGEFSAAASDKLNRIIKSEPLTNNPWGEVFSFYGLIEKQDSVPAANSGSTTLDDDFSFE